MSAVKVVRLYVGVELPYIKANFSFNGISFHTKKYIYKGQNHEPNHVRQVNALPPLQFCTLSPHMVKIKLFNSWPHLHSNFLGTTPTCKTMGPSYAIQVYGATYGQLFLLSRDFFLFVQKFKKN